MQSNESQRKEIIAHFFEHLNRSATHSRVIAEDTNFIGKQFKFIAASRLDEGRSHATRTLGTITGQELLFEEDTAMGMLKIHLRLSVSNSSVLGSPFLFLSYNIEDGWCVYMEERPYVRAESLHIF